MDYKNLQDLIKAVSGSELTYFEAESEGMHIVMKKEQLLQEEAIKPVVHTAVKDNIPVQKELQDTVREEHNIAEEKAEKHTDDKNIVTVTSPIVGTLYLAAGPDKDNFVSIGSRVNKGDVLCIIEAMKLMNEIESEVSGEVVEILAQNEEMVEYGEPLFRIRTDI